MLFYLVVGCLSFSHAQGRPMHFEEYDHDNYWARPPEVIICTMQTHFSVEDVKQALALWKREVIRIRTRKQCDYELERGKIKIVDGALLDQTQWGYTSYLYSEEYKEDKVVRQYKAAVVQLDSEVQDSALLIHELGHAFGYHHYDKAFDVMNAVTTYH